MAEEVGCGHTRQQVIGLFTLICVFSYHKKQLASGDYLVGVEGVADIYQVAE